jgi:hypothetical protein
VSTFGLHFNFIINAQNNDNATHFTEELMVAQGGSLTSMNLSQYFEFR